jgi:hypothetical protein
MTTGLLVAEVDAGLEEFQNSWHFHRVFPFSLCPFALGAAMHVLAEVAALSKPGMCD